MFRTNLATFQLGVFLVLAAYRSQNRPKLKNTAQNRLVPSSEPPGQLWCVWQSDGKSVTKRNENETKTKRKRYTLLWLAGEKNSWAVDQSQQGISFSFSFRFRFVAGFLSLCHTWLGKLFEEPTRTRTRQERRWKAVERRWNSRLISIPAQIYRIKFPTQIDSSPNISHQIAPKTRLKSIPAQLNRLKGLKEIGDFLDILSNPPTGWMRFWANENHRCPT